jgi:hypothetical protein
MVTRRRSRSADPLGRLAQPVSPLGPLLFLHLQPSATATSGLRMRVTAPSITAGSLARHRARLFFFRNDLPLCFPSSWLPFTHETKAFKLHSSADRLNTPAPPPLSPRPYIRNRCLARLPRNSTLPPFLLPSRKYLPQ